MQFVQALSVKAPSGPIQSMFHFELRIKSRALQRLYSIYKRCRSEPHVLDQQLASVVVILDECLQLRNQTFP